MASSDGLGRSGTVVAWPRSLPSPPSDLVRAGLAGDPRVRLATSEPNGAFTLHDLEPGLEWNVAAGAPGLAQGEPRRRVRPLDGPIELTLAPLYGARVVVRTSSFIERTPGGDPVWIRPLRNPLEDRQLPGAAYLLQPNYALDLAGVTSQLPIEGVLARYEYLFVASAEREVLGPSRWRLEALGAPAVERELWFPRVNASIDTVELPLGSFEPSNGRLEVRFVGQPQGLMRPTGRMPEHGWVELTDARGHTERYWASGSADRPLVIEGLAHGSYRARFVARLGGDALAPPKGAPGEPIEIGGAPVTWAVDLSGFGAVALDVVRPDGLSYSGPAMLVRLGGDATWPSAEAFEVQSASIDRAPYEIWPCTPGTHTIRMEHPTASASDRRGVLVEVRAGEIVRARVELAR